MARWVIVCVFSLGLAFSACARASDMRAHSVFSPSLGRNLNFLVYLPMGYEHSGLRYPVLYLLHGAGGSETDWGEKGHIQQQTDALIARGAIPPALIVMPGCPTCWWIDSAKDKSESAFWRDLVPAVEERYRVISGRSGRVIAGLSAGGFGVIHLALSYPDRLAAAAALSPAVYASAPPPESEARTSAPFLKADGTFDQSRWEAQNYPRLIERYFAQDQRVPFYLASGDHDELGIAFETALLFKRLRSGQPELTELRIVEGGHAWKVWEEQIDDAMTYLFRFAARPEPLGNTALGPAKAGLAVANKPAKAPSGAASSDRER